MAALTRANIDYAVVGGLAVILNGYPRVTVDVDVFLKDGSWREKDQLDVAALRKLLES